MGTRRGRPQQRTTGERRHLARTGGTSHRHRRRRREAQRTRHRARTPVGVPDRTRHQLRTRRRGPVHRPRLERRRLTTGHRRLVGHREAGNPRSPGRPVAIVDGPRHQPRTGCRRPVQRPSAEPTHQARGAVSPGDRHRVLRREAQRTGHTPARPPGRHHTTPDQVRTRRRGPVHRPRLERRRLTTGHRRLVGHREPHDRDTTRSLESRAARHRRPGGHPSRTTTTTNHRRTTPSGQDRRDQSPTPSPTSGSPADPSPSPHASRRPGSDPTPAAHPSPRTSTPTPPGTPPPDHRAPPTGRPPGSPTIPLSRPTPSMPAGRPRTVRGRRCRGTCRSTHPGRHLQNRRGRRRCPPEESRAKPLIPPLPHHVSRTAPLTACAPVAGDE